MPSPLSLLRDRYRSLGPWAQRGVRVVAALLAGVVLVPWFIYLAGRLTLGEYGGGGPFSLWADFFRGLADLSFGYWFAAAGPLVILALLSLWRKMSPRP
jgi:hypothetical protein